MNEVPGDYRENPPGMLRHMRKIDILKTFKTKFSFRMRSQFKDFPTNLPIGAAAPDFSLETAEGKRVSLKDFRGKKHVVLEFGSLT